MDGMVDGGRQAAKKSLLEVLPAYLEEGEFFLEVLEPLGGFIPYRFDLLLLAGGERNTVVIGFFPPGVCT